MKMLPSSPQLNTSGVKLIEDEEFDFDLPVSPPLSGVKVNNKGTDEVNEDGDDEDDIVFFGPVGHNEKCIAAAVEEEAQDIKPLSPLSNEQHAELYFEAQTLLFHLEQQRKSSSDSATSPKKTILQPQISNIINQGQFKRKLSDTSFVSVYSEGEVSDNMSQLSLQDQTTVSEATSSPGSEAGSKTKNRTFTLNSPEPVPENLSEVLPCPKLTANTDGVVKFGASQNKDKNSKNQLKPPRRSIPRISPPKKQRVLPAPGDSNNPTLNSRRSLAKPSTVRKSQPGGVPRRSGLKPPTTNSSMKAPQPVLNKQPVVSAQKTSLISKLPSTGSNSNKFGLKAPVNLNRTFDSFASMAASDNKPSGIKPPGSLNNSSRMLSDNKSTGMRQPGSFMKAPTPVGGTEFAKPGIRPPSSKLQLLKPGSITQQRKTLAATRTKPVKAGETPGGIKAPGPVKAFLPVPKIVVKTDLNTSTTSSSVTTAKPVKAVEPSIQATPTKQQKKVQPKKIFAFPDPKPDQENKPTPPRKNSDSSFTAPLSITPSQSAKRKSFLPTPRRCSVGGGYRSSGSSVSSIDSIVAGSPAIAKLISLKDDTPSCMQSKQSRVQHTPVGGNKENESKRSIWSPIRKTKHISREDEMIQCTKRTALATHN